MISRLVSLMMVFCVRLYQSILSPHIGSCCRFTPTCSNYFIDALRLHGPLYGSWLGIRRVLRCRPYGQCGFDPVPPRRWSALEEKKGKNE